MLLASMFSSIFLAFYLVGKYLCGKIGINPLYIGGNCIVSANNHYRKWCITGKVYDDPFNTDCTER